uniref:Uncharacterized protein n=1 Tax=Hemiselmis andersenii TaxID=464988 RepID=A0A6U2C5Q2_HEMAN|mmetsp:Transcript_19144/g.44128  ORF Transcript_19144/g.44128 Transcript_19144/m.44128 type:complete len:192 (+) Transcript_19144:209-784(+)
MAEEEPPVEPAPQEASAEAPPAEVPRDNLESTFEQEGMPYEPGPPTTMRSYRKGFVGAPPSSLAALATGKKYMSDPLTPLTPRPNRDKIRASTTGPPLATSRSNHWVTQTSQGYLPVRLQNHRIPKTPIEVKIGFPARAMPTTRLMDGSPAYLVDHNGHLLKQFRKPGRHAFPDVPITGPASWTFRRMGYV